MHPDLRLLQAVIQQHIEHLLQWLQLCLSQCDAQLLRQIPLGQQLQFAQHQRPVVGRQHIRP